jgi:predicted nucleic acid-binding protein
VILVDTSAWVEFLRATGSATHYRVRDLLATDEASATTEVVIMEVLAGARDEMHLERLRQLLLRCEVLPLRGLADYEAAAELYRRCRREGETIRAVTDCLIAVPTIRAGAEVLHLDRDFDVIATCGPADRVRVRDWSPRALRLARPQQSVERCTL